MRFLLIVPPGFHIPEHVRSRLGRHFLIREVPDTAGHYVDLEIPHPEQTGVLLFASGAVMTEAKLLSLLELSEPLLAEHMAVAFVPGYEQRSVLAAAASVYAFPGREVHLAGGFDSRLPRSALGLDTQFRLAGRYVGAIALGTPLVDAIPQLPTASYLQVFTKNVTSKVQLAYLAPLFAGLVDHSLRATGVDTTALDLQRSPGGDTESTLSVPAGAFDGAQLLRDWGTSLKEVERVKYVTSESRRIPDSRLPYLEDFVDEMWRSTGIGEARREILERAFADIQKRRPQIALVARSDDDSAVQRMRSIAEHVVEDLYWWDPATQTMRLRHAGETEWAECEDPEGSRTGDIAISYLIGVSVREAPWAQTSPGIVIMDFTTTDLASKLSAEWVGHSVATPFHGPRSLLLGESLRRADRVVASSEWQRDFILGAVATLHRLDQYTYDEDPSLRTLISIENGEEAAMDALRRPVHPFDLVRTTPEYEHSPQASLAKSMSSPRDHLRRFATRATDRLKGARQ